MKLFAIESWNEDSIFGMVDLGKTVSMFTSERGKEPSISRSKPFVKSKYRDMEHLAGVIGKFLPYFSCLVEPISIESLAYEDLIDICKEKFKWAKLEHDKTPDEIANKSPKTSKQIPPPEEDDEDYSGGSDFKSRFLK